jgi:hypothetical protein
MDKYYRVGSRIGVILNKVFYLEEEETNTFIEENIDIFRFNKEEDVYIVYGDKFKLVDKMDDEELKNSLLPFVSKYLIEN